MKQLMAQLLVQSLLSVSRGYTAGCQDRHSRGSRLGLPVSAGHDSRKVGNENLANRRRQRTPETVVIEACNRCSSKNPRILPVNLGSIESCLIVGGEIIAGHCKFYLTVGD